MENVLLVSNVHKLLNIVKEKSGNELMKSKIGQFQIEILESLIEEKKKSDDFDEFSDLGDRLERLSDSSSEKNR